MKSIIFGAVLPFIICVVMAMQGCVIELPKPPTADDVTGQCELLDLKDQAQTLVIHQYSVLYDDAVSQANECVDEYNALAEQYNELVEMFSTYMLEHPEL